MLYRSFSVLYLDRLECRVVSSLLFRQIGGEGRELFQYLPFPNYLQLKIILIPKWHFWGGIFWSLIILSTYRYLTDANWYNMFNWYTNKPMLSEIIKPIFGTLNFIDVYTINHLKNYPSTKPHISHIGQEW